MHIHMLLKVGRRAIGLLTDLALVGSQPTVHLLVSVQIADGGKSLATIFIVTHVRPQFVVHAHMDEQFCPSCEYFGAQIAPLNF
jgi:hypothetical protein